MIKVSDELIIYFSNFKSKEISERDYMISVISTINTETPKKNYCRDRREEIYFSDWGNGNLVKVTPEFKTFPLNKSSLRVFRKVQPSHHSSY